MKGRKKVLVKKAQSKRRRRPTKTRIRETDIGEMLASADLAVLFLDAELRLLRFTPTIEKLFAVLPADLGRSLKELAPKFGAEKFLRDVRAVRTSGRARELEIQAGSGKFYACHAAPMRGTKGAVKGVTLSFFDISDRTVKEAKISANENRYRLILGGIKEYGIFLLDLEGRFEIWTAGAEKILGYTEAETRGQNLDLLHTAEDRATELAKNELARAKKEGNALVERWHVRKDGSRFWALGTLSLLRDEQGQPCGFVKVVRDNTDRKFAEDELRRAMISAEAANASKDHFLANVSHELRTPLSATLLWSKLLYEQTEMDSELLKEGLEAINRSAKEQQVLIEDLMDTSKIVAGKMRLQPSVFDLNDLLRTLLPPIRILAAEKQITVDENLDPNTGIVRADPRRLQQVVSNLVNNSIKFTPSSGRISVQTLRNGDAVEIRVSDTGSGIAKEFLTRIFDRFVQVDQGTTPTASGMGLGLAIAKQLVEMHEGTIRAESPGKDRGAIFAIKLPLPRLTEDEIESPAEVPATASLQGRCILLVEDSAETLKALRTVLTEAKAEVTAVSTVNDALKEYGQAAPDLILSDIGLGNNSGHSLIAEIRKREIAQFLSPVPAMALTAYADETNRRKAFESGFQDCATKPIDPVSLINKLANLVSSR